MDTPLTLPALREDLHLQRGASNEDGSPGWLIYDSLRNRYFKIGERAFLLLSHWQAGLTSQEIIARSQAEGQSITEEELTELLQFLQGNQLVDASWPSQQSVLLRQYQSTRKNPLNWLIHNYLFIRIPLFRPDRFLKKSWPWVGGVLNPTVVNGIRVLGVVGMLAALQQWDQFLSTFLSFFSWQGLLLYLVTLIVVKSAHELGHAYVAHSQGVRVASIGVAFLVLFPVLYTDVTDAWRLRQRQKLKITLAGMSTELHIALLATFLWAVVPDGTVRSVLFFLATTSWLTSLAVNISPFLRFDGYFALSDLSNVENLQPRAFAMAQWQLRQWLFGFNDPQPEVVSEHKKVMFCLYAYATWVYRLFLFLGIALLVYHFAFKALGIILFLVEIIYFILRPIYNEVRFWVKRAGDLRWNAHTKATTTIVSILLSLFFAPLQSSISAPAILEVSRYAQVFPERAAKIDAVYVSSGEQVTKGQILYQLIDENLNAEIEKNERSLALIEQQLTRLVGENKNLDQRMVMLNKQRQQQQALNGLMSAQSRLAVRSPINGKLAFLETTEVGRYVNPQTLLVGIQSEGAVKVIAYVDENDVEQVSSNAEAKWIPNLIERPSLGLTVQSVAAAASDVLPYIELASDLGGPIATRPLSEKEFRPEQAIYRVELSVSGPESYSSAQRELGLVKIHTDWYSPVYRVLRHAIRVLIEETGF